jgi:tRNA1(Val) A37 N6-methylase TrmN6
MIVVAYYHDQPPVDTPAKRTKAAKRFLSTTTLQEVMRWADELTAQHGELVQVEIVIPTTE